MKGIGRLTRLKVIGPLILAVGLGGCASPVPAPIRQPLAEPVSFETVRRAPESVIGRTVRLGGSILEVRNRAETTVIEVLQRPLGRQGRPRPGGDSQGRFLAVLEGFHDPLVYTQEHGLTVVGRMTGTQTGPIEDYRYAYPTIQVTQHWLWEPESEPTEPAYGYPLYYPFGCDPWWPYRCYP